MQLFNKTLNSMKTKLMTIYPHQSVHVVYITSKVYRIINAHSHYLFFQEYNYYAICSNDCTTAFNNCAWKGKHIKDE